MIEGIPFYVVFFVLFVHGSTPTLGVVGSSTSWGICNQFAEDFEEDKTVPIGHFTCVNEEQYLVMVALVRNIRKLKNMVDTAKKTTSLKTLRNSQSAPQRPQQKQETPLKYQKTTPKPQNKHSNPL